MKAPKQRFKTTPVTVEPLVAHMAFTPTEASRTLWALRSAASVARENGSEEDAYWYYAYATNLEAKFKQAFARWEYHRR